MVILLHRTSISRTTTPNLRGGLSFSAETTDEIGMQERRIYNRLLCADLVEVWWDFAGRQQRRVANLEDISLCGVCLQMEKKIEPDTKVVIRYGDGALVGVVRYCAYRDMGFFIGVELAESSRWSTQHYKPEHLLDTRELLEHSIMRRCLSDATRSRPN